MIASVSDRTLLREFAESRSEGAFAALVERHADLVFATALRRVGDTAAAQEVAQDVFVALARKAAGLGEEVSLAGWLYRTALLQARHWWRGEQRRRQREQTAVELNTTMKDDESLLKSLVGVLDDGLRELSEAERQALLLRFFERQSHREVGDALGIAEDAARKRVDKALAQLTAFFQKRGYAVGSVAAVAAALEAAAATAPVGFAAAAAQAAVAASVTGGASVLVGWLAGFLRPTRAQTAVLVTAVLLVPAVWQGARWLSACEEQRRMDALLSALQGQNEDVARELAQVRRRLRQASNRLAQLRVPSSYTAYLTEAGLDPRLFRWDESADYVRVPKEVMRWLSFESDDLEEKTLNTYGAPISPTLVTALGLSPEEQAHVQQFAQGQLDAYRAAAESRSYLTNVLPPDPGSYVKSTAETRAWVTPALSTGESGLLRQCFEQGLANVIGAERAAIVLRNASDDNSLDRFCQRFGSEDLVIAVSPSLAGGCQLSRQGHSLGGSPSWQSSRVPLSAAMSITQPQPVKSPGHQVTSLDRSSMQMWHTLGRHALPAALVDYLREWTAAHPEVPDEPPQNP